MEEQRSGNSYEEELIARADRCGWTVQRSASGEGYSAVNRTQQLMGEVELLDSLGKLAEFVQREERQR